MMQGNSKGRPCLERAIKDKVNEKILMNRKVGNLVVNPMKLIPRIDNTISSVHANKVKRLTDTDGHFTLTMSEHTLPEVK